MSRLIDADAIKLEKGFFENIDNVPKFYEWLGKQPTIDAVEVVHGMWLEEGNSCSYIFHCSVCGGVAYFVHGKGRGRNMERRFCGYRYCPNCGAKMDGDANKNE